MTHVTSKGDPTTAEYLAGLLVAGVHCDSLYSVRDRTGCRVESISELIAEGDVRQNADSFAREREVHQHIGDFILFWTGVQPDFLLRMKVRAERDLLMDYRSQARESYDLVANYETHRGNPAEVFLRLRDGFDDYSFCLRDVRDRLRILPPMSA